MYGSYPLIFVFVIGRLEVEDPFIDDNLETILSLQLFMSTFHCAAFVQWDYFGGCLPVAVVLFVGQQMGLKKNHISVSPRLHVSTLFLQEAILQNVKLVKVWHGAGLRLL